MCIRDSFKTEVIQKVGCVPIYWQSFNLSQNNATFCNSLEKMAEAFEAVTNIGQTMNRYVKPCDYMEVSLGADQLDTYLSAPDVVLMQFVYMKKQYQEVVNLREFGFNSCWSSIGGFVGIFIGYSLLNFPETLANFLIWCGKKKFRLH